MQRKAKTYRERERRGRERERGGEIKREGATPTHTRTQGDKDIDAGCYHRVT